VALGAEGEQRAAAHLEARGYRIADRNVRAGGVEIDLVALRGDLVVFVEVKTRRSRRHGGGAEAVGRQKRRRLVEGARAWLSSHRRRHARVRFDVIEWTVEPGARTRWRLVHFEAAFDAGD
jgi:putative endonuclease